MADSTAPSTFLITIAAVDKATATMQKINARVDAMKARVSLATKPIRDMQAAFKRLGAEAGVGKLVPHFQRVHEMAGRVYKALTTLVAPLAAISGAASVAGMVHLVDRWGDFGLRLGQAAARAKMAVGDFNALGNAAELGGSSANAMASGMKTLGDHITDAAGGRDSEFIVLLNSIGISMRNANGTLKTNTELLPEIADKLKTVGDATLKARIATGAFGGAGEELVPVLNKGSAGIKSLTDRAKQHGVITEEGARTAAAYASAQEDVKQSVTGLGNAIASKLAPHLIPLLLRLSTWVDANRDRIAHFFDRFAHWLDTIDFDAVATRIENLAKGIDGVVQRLGGWQNAIVGLIAFMAANWDSVRGRGGNLLTAAV